MNVVIGMKKVMMTTDTDYNKKLPLGSFFTGLVAAEMIFCAGAVHQGE